MKLLLEALHCVIRRPIRNLEGLTAGNEGKYWPFAVSISSYNRVLITSLWENNQAVASQANNLFSLLKETFLSSTLRTRSGSRTVGERLVAFSWSEENLEHRRKSKCKHSWPVKCINWRSSHCLLNVSKCDHLSSQEVVRKTIAEWK